ncbi:MAG TPA: transcriptional repressor [Mycobacteriales bacterium]|nr:transcriptional repressor [Mycobacteriales bacterium]
MAPTELQHELRARGYRLTPQRQLVLDAIRGLGHATPESILAEVRRTAPAVNITTVYRNLELLEQLELVRHTHLDHGAPTYHPAEDEHVHVVCRHCEEVSEAPTELVAEVVSRLAEERGFAVDVGHITIFGTCARCQAS